MWSPCLPQKGGGCGTDDFEKPGETAARELYYAALSRDGEKGEAILGAMLAARKLRDSRRIMEQLQEPHVARVFELSRNVKNETHSFLEFIRFRELESRILLARIRPKNQVLSCIAPHFADRLPLENWMILDETWHMAAVHEKQKQWVLVRDVPDFPGGQLKFSAQEEEMTRLWQGSAGVLPLKSGEMKSCSVPTFRCGTGSIWWSFSRPDFCPGFLLRDFSGTDALFSRGSMVRLRADTDDRL